MFKNIRNDIDRSMRSFLRSARTLYDLETDKDLLSRCIEDFVLRSGKRIRPILFILSYLGYTDKNRVPYEDLLRSSLSVELLHDFLLVHDDVIDKSSLRRGKPTLHRLFNSELGLKTSDHMGPSLSIVAGDIIFSLAVEALLSFNGPPKRKEKALNIFNSATISTGTGEFLDVINDRKDISSITEQEIFRTYTLKTSRYTFEAPLLIGSILGGAIRSDIRKLSSLGIALGQAFQIQDDLLDIFSSSKKIGKPVLSDLNESKKTLAVWRTYTSLSGNDRKTLVNILKKERKTYGDLLRFRRMIKDSGADSYCRETALSLFAEASCICTELKMDKKYRFELETFIRDLAGKTGIS